MPPDLVTSLIYVSRKSLPNSRASDIDNILLVSRKRNKELEVTGALFSTSNTFAQFIEGPELSIHQWMNSIRQDARHRDVKVLSVRYEVQRKFAAWTMAYSGEEYYIDKQIRRLIDVIPPSSFAERVEELEDLFEEFGKKIKV